MRRTTMLWIAGAVGLAAAVLWGPIVSDVEQATYSVVSKQDAIEIRDYAPMIVAEAQVQGEREKAISDGFRLIAGYIFGDNTSSKNVSEKIAMTAPVIQQASEKIAMTAPVIQQGDGDSWKVRFVMPASYTMDTLPKPNNKAVVLKEVDGKRFAVIRFSGMAGESSIKEHTEELQAYVKEQKLKAISPITYAFYNPPWTLPFLRRNEVMVEIAK